MTQSNLPKPVLPHEVLRWHMQTSQLSCAASGMEVILKLHDIIPLDDFSLQTKYGDRNIGFAEIHELTSRGIQATTYSKLIPDALFQIEEEIQKGKFPLVSLPIHKEGGEIYFHIYIAEPNNGLIRLLDPANRLCLEGGKVGLATAIECLFRRFELPLDRQLDFLTYRIDKSEK